MAILNIFYGSFYFRNKIYSWKTYQVEHIYRLITKGFIIADLKKRRVIFTPNGLCQAQSLLKCLSAIRNYEDHTLLCLYLQSYCNTTLQKSSLDIDPTIIGELVKENLIIFPSKTPYLILLEPLAYLDRIRERYNFPIPENYERRKMIADGNDSFRNRLLLSLISDTNQIAPDRVVMTRTIGQTEEKNSILRDISSYQFNIGNDINYMHERGVIPRFPLNYYFSIGYYSEDFQREVNPFEGGFLRNLLIVRQDEFLLTDTKGKIRAIIPGSIFSK